MSRAERLRELERLYFQRAYSDIELAERLEVNRTTVYRDRQELMAEIPFVQDENDRWRIDRTQYLSSIRVDLKEALTLYLAARRASQQTRSAQTHAASALEKLALALRQPMTERLVKAADVILAQRHQPGSEQIFGAVARAWVERRLLRIRYSGLDSDRVYTDTLATYLIEPSPWSDSVYVVGQSQVLDKIAAYRLDRIQRAVVSGDSYEIPTDFDEEALLRYAWGIWRSDREPETVRLRFRAGPAATRLGESVWHPLETVTTLDGGDVLWEAPIAEPREMLPWVRQWGADVEVLAPDWLRARLKNEARRLTELYGLAATEPKKPIAHTRNQDGVQHDLHEHLTRVSEMASDFAEPFGASDLAYWLGMWHDIGKLHPEFQKYLQDVERGDVPPGGPDHKAAGVAAVLDHGLAPLALLLQGHHGGLRNSTDFKAWYADKRERAEEIVKSARLELDNVYPESALNFPDFVQDKSHRRRMELFVRFLFSSLVDADFLDTEQHFNPGKASRRGYDVSLATLWERFQRDQNELVRNTRPPESESQSGYPVYQARQEIYDACVKTASQPPGLFRLTVPTGGGKTRSGMAFALRHALKHDMRQIVVAVPFISITEQTAEVYRDIFEVEDAEEQIVLEHHSGGIEAAHEETDYDPQEIWSRLAAENWDAPIVVTTTVQLFESLFARGARRCRKLHRLARSVIVLDEVQALPAHLLDPILDILQSLCEYYGCTVVFCTATQPAYEALPIFDRIQPAEIVPEPARHFAALKRVRYDWRLDTELSWPEIADLMREESQALAIVNTKKDAMSLLDELGEAPDLFHLSTLLCGMHRAETIEEIKRRLLAGEPCRVISTQVVEAGVDLDFPLVLRALAPLHSIIQAAGRANREGKLETGRLIVFWPAEGGIPRGTYQRQTQMTRAFSQMEASGLDMDDPETVRRYFSHVFPLEDTDRKGIQEKRSDLDYLAIAEKFRMIDDATISVIVPYGSEEEQWQIEKWIERIEWKQGNPRRILRRLQPYTVNLYTHQALRYQEQGLISPVQPGLGIWTGGYDNIRGLTAEDLSPDQLIF